MTDAPVIALVERRPDSGQIAVIEKLHELLAWAEAGEVTGIAYAITKPGGWVGQGWTATENTALLLGATSILQQRMAQRLADAGEEATA